MNYFKKIKWQIIMIFIFGISFSSMFLLGLNTNYGVQSFKDINNISQKLDQNFDDNLNSQFSHLSLGGDYSGVVFTDEKGNDHLYMWGSNINGRLGDGKHDNSSVPIEIDPDGTSNRDGTSDGIQGTITNLSLSPNHSGVVIKDEGGNDHLYMWGYNKFGQLGNGTNENSNVPIEIDPDGNSDGTPDGIQGTITNLSLGDYHSGVVINDDNGIDHLYMWGNNDYGQFGDGTNDNSNVPIEIDPDGTSNRDGTSDGIQGTVTNLSLGSNNSGIVIQTGEKEQMTDHIYMWGISYENAPIEIDPDGNPDGTPNGIQGIITNFAVGAHSGVVIKDEGGNDHLYMWGQNSEGQLGDGTNNNSNVPIEINVDEKTAGGDAPGIQGTITNLSVEKNFTGTVINDNNGVDHLYMWGGNGYRQLGNDSDVDSNIPIEINVDEETPGGDAPGIQGTITNISFGWYHSGVVIQDKNGIDHLYMWGKGDEGQLGNGNTTIGTAIEITPALIIGETTIDSLTDDLLKTKVTINWDWEQNSAFEVDKFELTGTNVDGNGATSIELTPEDGSYSINLEYGTYDDWQINYSTNFGYGTVDIKPFTSLEKAIGKIFNISILDINYIDENNINATFGFEFDFKGTTEIKDSKITISGDNFTEQTVDISKDNDDSFSFSIDLDYGTKYDLTVNYNLVTETDQIGTKGESVEIPSFQTVEHVKAPTINSVSIDEESITATIAILNYSINIPDEGDSISTQNTIITKIEVIDESGTSYGFIDNNENKQILKEGYIELSGLIPEQSYNDLYIVVYAEGDVAGDEVIVNADDSIEEGHIGGFKLSISMIILYSALLIFAIGSIIGLIIGLTWYFIRRKKSLIM